MHIDRQGQRKRQCHRQRNQFTLLTWNVVYCDGDDQEKNPSPAGLLAHLLLLLLLFARQ